MDTTRTLPRHTMISPAAGHDSARTLTSDDYPLVEISPEPALGGHWLFLHPAPGVPAEAANSKFLPEGQSLPLACSRMLTSFYCRSTPPPATVPPNRRPVPVYTAQDHLTR